MPNLDGTGPQGQGQKTGRGLGDCTGQQIQNPPGRGLGRSRGLRGRWCRLWNQPQNQNNQK
jgi:hypothetical protein